MASQHVESDGLTNGSSKGESGRGLLKERAYVEIKRGILSGKLAAGSFLAERQLAAQLGMSKTPVRSALERLESEGLLSISPQQGAIIRDLAVTEVADQYEIRMAIESFVVRALAGKLAPRRSARCERTSTPRRRTSSVAATWRQGLPWTKSSTPCSVSSSATRRSSG